MTTTWSATSHTTPGGQVIPLGLACRASLAGYLDAGDVFAITRQGFDFYERLFGTGYPFAKYDQVFVPEFAGGAMENVGLRDDLRAVPVPAPRSPT